VSIIGLHTLLAIFRLSRAAQDAGQFTAACCRRAIKNRAIKGIVIPRLQALGCSCGISHSKCSDADHIGAAITQTFRVAKHLEVRLAETGLFEIYAPVALNIVRNACRPMEL
jgi:hypothetical protein